MKKLALALAATAAFAGQAVAADLAARPYTKAPPVVMPVANWTGCYLGAGGGAAMTNNDHHDIDNVGVFVPAGTQAGPNLTTGARGWFGTVQGGCDYQFAGTNWVIGAFADYDFMDVKGDLSTFGTFFPSTFGSQKQDWQWAAGGRVGYVLFPQLLTYVSAGYTQAHWKDTNMSAFGAPGVVTILPGQTRSGWFVGTGDEYALSFLPGLFWKTEYRYSEFDSSTQPILVPGGGLTGFSENQKFREHSIRSELVWRFNWTGPVVAKY